MTALPWFGRYFSDTGSHNEITENLQVALSGASVPVGISERGGHAGGRRRDSAGTGVAGALEPRLRDQAHTTAPIDCSSSSRRGASRFLPRARPRRACFSISRPKCFSTASGVCSGLAFHPQFATNSRFFVNYTRQTDGATVIAEFHASSDPAVTAASESVLLVIAQPFANHNGGMIEFGADGYLYIGMGDGGSFNDPGNRAQNINELLGKILRIDVDHPAGGLPYSSPPGNPFVGATPGRDEIFAVGLRNPFRFSFDRQTGQLYVGDVGQGALEEVDIVTAGGNYGWRVYEGTQCTNLDPGLCTPTNFVTPIAQYGHSGGRCSITGGYVYRGSAAALPAGTYVFGDFCTGEIFSAAGGAPNVLLDTALNISSFGEDEAGEIYVVGLGGTVHRIAPVSPSVDDDDTDECGHAGAGGSDGDLHRDGERIEPDAAASASPPTASPLAGCSAVALTGTGNSRTATCPTSSLAVGVHSIVASYAGDAGNAASSSAPLSQVITAPAGSTNVALASAGAVASASSTYSAGYPVDRGQQQRAGRRQLGQRRRLERRHRRCLSRTGCRSTSTAARPSTGSSSIRCRTTTPTRSSPPTALTFTQYGITDFTVQGWNGSAWVTLATVSGNNLVKRSVTFAAFTTDRIRVNVTNALAGYSRITEIEAWGVAAASLPPTTTTLTSAPNPGRGRAPA